MLTVGLSQRTVWCGGLAHSLGSFAPPLKAPVPFFDTPYTGAGFPYILANVVPAGSLTYRDLFLVHPFGNSLVEMRLTGQQIYDH